MTQITFHALLDFAIATTLNPPKTAARGVPPATTSPGLPPPKPAVVPVYPHRHVSVPLVPR